MIDVTPHGDKLRSLLENEKLPRQDRSRVQSAIERYEEWLRELAEISGTEEELVDGLVGSLDRYKRYIDVDLIFDSQDDFLYRQKGQIKLDNTIIEEFVPWLVVRIFGDRLSDGDVHLGPANCFSHLRFDSILRSSEPGGGMAIRSKNQDFTIARKLFLRASHRPDFADAVEASTHLAYVATEIKTNLDKTMFQEAAATARDLKLVIPSSRYFLLCEWLDMVPISTSATSIEEVIILRKSRRLTSNVRKRFATSRGRSIARSDYVAFLDAHPFSPEAFVRFLSRIEPLLVDDSEDEDSVVRRGWF